MAPLRVLVTLVSITAALLAGGSSPCDAALGDPCLSSYSCADGDLCNGAERCDAGVCVLGLPLTCDDADLCSRDVCEAAVGCVHVEEDCSADCSGAVDGTRCADGSVCTRGDACAGGICVAGPAVVCDDADACTSEQCDPRYGCVYREEAVEFPCLPSCNGAVADYTPCPGDDNVCTLDGCLPSVDLIGDPHMCIIGLRGLERQCDDGKFCNGYELCSPTLGCEPGEPPVCDDGALCNGSEGCDDVLGCQPGTPAADGTACDDGLLCTANDVCGAGACGGTSLTPVDCSDGDATTGDACVEAFGCVHCRPQAQVRVAHHAAEIGRGRFTARGVLPAGTLAAFSAASEPAAVVMETAGGELTRVTLPPGALAANTNGTRLAYRTPQGDGGARWSVALQARANGVRWKARGSGLTLDAPAPTAVVRLLLGDACFATGVACSGPLTNARCR